MESISKKKSRKQDSQRLTLTKKAQEKAQLWLSQIEVEFNGMLTLKRNDLLNTILEELDEKLSSQLLNKIRNEKLTDKEKAKWIYQKILDAEKQGHETDLDELIKTAQGHSKTRKKSRKIQNKTLQTPMSKSAEISPGAHKKTSDSI